MGKTQISNGYNSKTVGCRRSCYTFPQPGWQALSTGKVKVIVKVKVDVWRSCKLTMCATWWWQLVDVCCLSITQAPIIPLILHDGDTRNFDIYPEANLQSLQPSPDADVELFRDFWPSSVAFRDDPSTFQCQLFWTESTSLLAGPPSICRESTVSWNWSNPRSISEDLTHFTKRLTPCKRFQNGPVRGGWLWRPAENSENLNFTRTIV